MKITFDTDFISTFVKTKSKQIWNSADPGHITLLGMCLTLSGFIIGPKVESLFKSDRCCVEVTLEKDSETVKLPPRTKMTQLFNTNQKLILSDREFNCLAKNIYWETSFEPLLGQIAVANVTYNRVLSGKWGNTFCDVVYAKKQFSWTNSKKLRVATPKNKTQWNRAKHSAMLFTKGVRVTNLNESEFYYAGYIKKPKWAKEMNMTAHIGQHIFYANNGE